MTGEEKMATAAEMIARYRAQNGTQKKEGAAQASSGTTAADMIARYRAQQPAQTTQTTPTVQTTPAQTARRGQPIFTPGEPAFSAAGAKQALDTAKAVQAARTAPGFSTSQTAPVFSAAQTKRTLDAARDYAMANPNDATKKIITDRIGTIDREIADLQPKTPQEAAVRRAGQIHALGAGDGASREQNAEDALVKEKQSLQGILDGEYGKKDADWLKVLYSMALRGSDAFVSGVASTADMLVGGATKLLLGLTDAEYESLNTPTTAFKNWARKNAEINDAYFARAAGDSGAARVAGELGAGVVGAVPQAVLAILSAGTSMAGQLGTAADGLGSLIIQVTQTMAKSPQYWLSFLQVAGDGYEDAKADGADDLTAMSYGLINGTLNAIVEVGGGGIDALPDKLQQGGRPLLKWVESSLDEGKEEVVQGIIERGFQNLIYGKGNPLLSLTDEDAVINPITSAKEFGGGVFVGGILGAGQAGVSTAINRAARSGDMKQLGAAIREAGAADALINEAKARGGEAAAMAQRIEEKRGKSAATDAQLGELYMQTLNQTQSTGGGGHGREGGIPENAPETVTATENDRNGTESARNGTESARTLTESAPETTKTAPRTAENPRIGTDGTRYAPRAGEGPVMLPTAEEEMNFRLSRNAKTELERSGILAGVDRETISRAQSIADTLGRDIVFYSSSSAGENGYRDMSTGRIYINAQSKNPTMQIIAHELTHSIEGSSSYDRLKKLILDRIQQQGGDLDALRQAKAELYARHSIVLEGEESIDAEIVAEYIEKNLLTDEESIISLVSEDRTLGRRIMDFIDRILARLGNEDAQERAFLTRAREYYAKALEETPRTEPERTGTDDYLMELREQLRGGEITDEEYDRLFDEYYRGGSEGQFSFGGERARNTDLNALKRAKEMREEDVADDVILRETGWYVGSDGKWRFEIDDSGMETDTKWNFLRNPDAKRYNELFEKAYLYDTATAEDLNELLILDKNLKDVRKSPLYLDEVVKHDKLFEAYPALRDVKVRFEANTGNKEGSYHPETNEIVLRTGLKLEPEALKSTLIHEIQHAVQEREGFARGTSPVYWDEMIQGGYSRRKNDGRIERAKQEYHRIFNSAPEEFKDKVRTINRARLDGDYDTAESVIDELYDSEYADLWSQLDMAEFEWRSDRGEELNAYELYRNTAGEIEARDAASRRNLTAGERRERMPDRGGENTVFAKGGDGYFAMSQSEQESVKEQLREHQDALNNMKAVATIRDNGWKGMSTGAFRQKIVNDLKKTGYRVDNPSIGVIDFNEKLLNRSLNYIQTDAEAAAYQALPQVLKRGIEISGHGNHKGRDYETLTIAAPVELNGKRGNMAVVVMKTKGNRYKVHRILTPEGGTFTLPEMTNAEPTTVGAVTSGSQSLGGSAPAISSASTGSVTENALPVKRKFSLDEPVERTDTLLALHNMTEEKLRRTLGLGAWPSPSIAIVEAEQGHEKYGEYSAVFPADVIDPQADRRNRVYGSDAWTPTDANARVEYEVDYDARRSIERNIEQLSKKVANGMFSRSGVLGSAGIEDVTDADAKSIAKKLASQDAVKAAYLASRGEDVDIAYKAKEFDSRFGNDALRKYIDKVGPQRLAELYVKLETGERLTPYETLTAENVIRQAYEEKHAGLLNRKPEKKAERIAWYMENNVTLSRVEDFIRHAQEYYADSGATTDEIDRMATSDRLNAAAKTADVEAWVEGQLGGLLGEPGIYNGKDYYTPSGDRRSFAETHWDYNVENIVRAMNNASSRGEGMWNVTGSTLAATATPEYGSIADMHADEGRLRRLDQGEYDRLMEDLSIELDRVTDDLMRTTKHHADNTYDEQQILGSIIAEAAQGKRTAAAIKQAFRKEGYAISDGHAQSIIRLLDHAAQVPTEYFEAKPQRVVSFDEAVAVVAPDNAPAELVEDMRKAGMNVVEYAAGDEKSRLDTINRLENVRFSVSERTPEEKKEIFRSLQGYLNGKTDARELRRYVDSLDESIDYSFREDSLGLKRPRLKTAAEEEAERIVRRAHGEGVGVEEYLRRSWDEYEVDGRLSEEARKALELERRQIRKYSQDEAGQERTQPDTGGQDDARAALPRKAQDYLRRTERTLVNRIGRAMSVPRLARRDYLEGIAREISGEYLRDGRISEETAQRLFDTAYDEGVIVDEEFYNQYKDLKDRLRTMAVTISEKDKADIADFNSFRKSAFGRLRIVNEGGMPVDVAYEELRAEAPELFPAELTHPADQLMRMFEAAQSIERSEKSLDEHFGYEADEFKRWAKGDFDAAINDTLSELRSIRRFAEERARAEEPAAIATQEEVKEAYKQLKEARRAYEKAEAKNLLTHDDEMQVGRLLRGETELRYIDPRKNNFRGIKAVYEAKQEYEKYAKTIRDWNESRRAELRKTADELLKTANSWKDKKAGILYARETMERNIYDIVKDRKLAKRIIDEYFTPVHTAQAQSTRLKNRMRDRVKKLDLSTTETKAMQREGKVSEAHAVQLIGEAMDNIRMLENSRGRMKERDGKTLEDWRSIVRDLWEKNPQLDRAKIEGAVEEFRSIYDELFGMMNETRLRNGYEPVNYRKGYFPHFQPGDGDGIMGLFGRALGIDTQVTALPTTINGLTHTFRPGIQWFSGALERRGFETAYNAVEGFDRYIEGVADVIYQTDNIQKLRALATQVRYRTGDEGIKKQVDAVRADTSLSEEDRQNRIDQIYKDGRFALSNFAVELEEYTNLLANKKSRADRNMEQALGRNMYNLTKALESRVAANMVAVNVGSWLTNYIPIVQGWATLNTKDLLRGMWQTLRDMKTSDGVSDASTFLTNRRGSDPLVRTWAQKTSAVLSSPMEHIDQFTAGSLVRARYNQNLRRGLSENEAMSEADSWAASVMADRSKGSTPTLFNRKNPITKLFTQFQLEVNNQLSYLFKDMPRELLEKGVGALALALFKFCLGAWLYDEVYEYFVGRRPALDPIGILNDTVGDLTGYELPNLVELGVGAATGDMPSFETEKVGVGEALKNLGENVAEQVPFVGGLMGGGRIPISSALPNVGNLYKAATNEDWSAKKKLYTAGKELSKPATYLIPPFGGGQVRKIYQGLEAVIRGGSYSMDSEGNEQLQYPVYTDTPLDTAKSVVQSTLFGKTALPGGREWIDSGFKSFSAKQTAVYKGLLDAGVGQKEAYRFIKDMGELGKTDDESAATAKRTFLESSDLSGEGKSVVYFGLLASDREREAMDGLAGLGADMGAVTQTLISMKAAGDKDSAKLKALSEAGLGDEETIALAGLVMGTELVTESGAMSQYAKLKACVDAGMSAADALEAKGEGARLDKLLELTDAGLEPEAAERVALALAALEPEEGKTQVSDAQRWRAALDAAQTGEEEMNALKAVMDERQFAKLGIARDYGIDPELFVSLKEVLPQFDENENGSINADELEAAIDAMGGGLLPAVGRLTQAQQAALWQIYTTSTDPSKNPFGPGVGWKVHRAKESAMEEIKAREKGK